MSKRNSNTGSFEQRLLQHTKMKVKRAIAAALYYSGLLFLLKYFALRRKGVILMYHRVLDEQEQERSFSHPGIIVNTEIFARQLDFLKKHFHIVGEKELLAYLDGKMPLPRSCCVITFDDGWFDNYSNAYPLLKSRNIPATICLVADFISSRDLFWQEKLASLLFRRYYLTPETHSKSIPELNRWNLTTLAEHEAKEKIREYITGLKNLKDSTLQKLLDDFFQEQCEAPEMETLDRFLTWSQVKEMMTQKISFGAHSIHHKILTKLPLDKAKIEIEGSGTIIQQNIKRRPNIFCYPNGDFSHEVRKVVAEAGYKAALSTREGRFNEKDDRFSLPRVNIHQGATDTIPLFLSKLLGIF